MATNSNNRIHLTQFDRSIEPVAEITYSNTQNCPDGFEQAFSGNWAGIALGCDCRLRSRILKNCKNTPLVVVRGTCTQNKTNCACSESPTIPPNPFKVWPSGDSFCLRRASNLSFLAVYKNMDENGSCVSPTFKKCGGAISSATTNESPGICIPIATPCPLTDLKFSTSTPNASIYSKVVGSGSQGSSLFYSSSPSLGEPIVDLKSSENGICVNQSKRLYTAGRQPFNLSGVLDDEENRKCLQDKRFEDLGDSRGELEVLDANQVPYTQVSGYSTTNLFVWRRLMRRMTVFRANCLGYVDRIAKFGVRADAVEGYLNTAKVLEMKRMRMIFMVFIDFCGFLLFFEFWVFEFFV